MSIRGEVFRKPIFNKAQKILMKQEIEKDSFMNFSPVIKTKECCEKTGRIIIKNTAVSFFKINELGNEIKLIDVRDPKNWLREVCQMKFENMEAVNE